MHIYFTINFQGCVPKPAKPIYTVYLPVATVPWYGDILFVVDTLYGTCLYNIQCSTDVHVYVLGFKIHKFLYGQYEKQKVWELGKKCSSSC